jgi:hypothetical protein
VARRTAPNVRLPSARDCRPIEVAVLRGQTDTAKPARQICSATSTRLGLAIGTRMDFAPFATTNSYRSLDRSRLLIWFSCRTFELEGGLL